MKKSQDQLLDEGLVIRIQDGEREAMHLFIKRWNLALYQRISYLTNNPEIAKDLLQEAWSSILKSFPSLKEPEKYKAWMMTIASRKAYDWIRKIRKHQLLSLDTIDTNDVMDSDENSNEDLIKLLRQSIRELDQSQRIILTMFYIENLTIQEIAKQLKIPIGTVKSRLFYARELLKEKITKGVFHEK